MLSRKENQVSFIIKIMNLGKRWLTICLLFLILFSGVLSAQGRKDWAFEHVKEVQQRNTNSLMMIKNVEGTAIGINRNGQLVLKVFTSKPNVRGFPI